MTRLLATVCIFSLGFLTTPALHAQIQEVNELTSNQWVRRTASGAVRGRVVLPLSDGRAKALKDVRVAIKQRGGATIEARTNAAGQFTLSRVPSGIYALTARGENVFACYALHVIEDSLESKDQFPEELQIPVAELGFKVARTAIIRYLPPEGWSVTERQLRGVSNHTRGSQNFRVALHDGVLRGRLYYAGTNGTEFQGAELTNVFIFKDGVEVNRTLTDEEGRFGFADMTPGVCSLVAIGRPGIGVIGFELVDQSTDSDRSAALTRSGTQLVSTAGEQQLVLDNGTAAPQDEFEMQISPTEETTELIEEINNLEDETGEEPILDGFVMDGFGSPLDGGLGGGGFGGPGAGGPGGGGFGGGGGGGFGTIAGIAAIAGFAFAATDDDNAFAPVIASPSSPSN